MLYDVAIVGGGPGGLSAALALGRARKRVVVFDAAPRRNAAATHIHNFVTRDGTPPDEFRSVGRAQLAMYPTVEVRDTHVEAVTGARGAFRVAAPDVIEARRVLLATGMVDQMLPIDGFRELWGRSIFQCPYCHGWEVQDRKWGVLALPHTASHLLPFALMVRGWTKDVVVFTNGAHDVPAETRAALQTAGIGLETATITRLTANRDGLDAIELADGRLVPRDVLFTHPLQQQVELVSALGLALDEDGYVKVDPMKRETSVAGIYASGDLTTRMQAAVIAAASGMQAAAMINVELSMELALAGEL